MDNASLNDTAIGYFKKKMLSWGASSIRLKFLHMRCLAHILNLVVNDGLKEINVSIKKVREAIRYIRNSPARLSKFREIYDLIGVELKCSLYLDVPTRWNSTYIMLKTVCLFKKTFNKYKEIGSSLISYLGDDILAFCDWECIRQMVDMLKVFYEITVKISCSNYVITNSFFSEISDLNYIINDWQSSSELSVYNMAINMK